MARRVLRVPRRAGADASDPVATSPAPGASTFPTGEDPPGAGAQAGALPVAPDPETGPADSIGLSGAPRDPPGTSAGGAPPGPGSEPPGARSELPGLGSEPLVPPADPDDWSDDQWLAWLGQGDEEGDAGEPPAARVQRSSGGQILGNAMLGLAEAMYGQKRPEVVVEADAPGDPVGDDLQLYLDPEHPEDSIVVVPRSRRRRGRPASPGTPPDGPR